MTADVALRLRELARERSDGRLTLADYRRLRAPLLDLLVSHDPAPVDESSLMTRPRAVTRAPESVRAPDEGGEVAIVGGVRRLRIAPWMLWAFAVGSVLTAGIATWIPRRGEAGTRIDPVEVSVVAAAVAEPPATRAGTEQGRETARGVKSQSSAQTPTSPSDSRHVARVSRASSCQIPRSGAPLSACEDQLSTRAAGPRLLVIPAAEGAFAVSARAISQAQFRAWCVQKGQPFPGQPWVEGDDAVVNVTWDEAREYVQWLSNETGQRYRLPTEAEWSRAARILAGHRDFTAGKVREWVQDTWTAAPGSGVSNSNQRVVRGASYADDESSLLSARRDRDATIRDALTGFRVVRDVRVTSAGEDLSQPR